MRYLGFLLGLFQIIIGYLVTGDAASVAAASTYGGSLLIVLGVLTVTYHILN